MVFLFVILLILITIIIIFTSSLEIKILNLLINLQNRKHINDKYEIIIKLNILKKIPIIKIRITQDKLKKIFRKLEMKEKIKKLERDIYINKDKIDLKLIDTVKEINKKIDIECLNLEVKLGTENAFFTSIIVAIISTIISIIISKKDVKKEKMLYEIKPIYGNQNLLNMYFFGILKIKMIHIINIIYLIRKGGIKNE